MSPLGFHMAPHRRAHIHTTHTLGNKSDSVHRSNTVLSAQWALKRTVASDKFFSPSYQTKCPYFILEATNEG